MAGLLLSYSEVASKFSCCPVVPTQVFAEVMALVLSCIDGYNVCIFAYGQTGSGKTHTMEVSVEFSDLPTGQYFSAINQYFSINQ